MTASTDFSPVAGRGELKPESGLLGRFRRKQDLEPVGSGFVRILLDEQGSPIASGEQLSAGQKYWSRGRSWVKVDVGTHRLEYEVDFPDPSGSAEFVARVAVTASVEDAVGAAADGCTNVAEILVPVLEEAVAVVTGKVTRTKESDPIAALHSMRKKARNAVRKLVGESLDVPPWLSARVTAVTVEFDSVTAQHHATLVERKHGGHLIAADGENEMVKTETAMKIRDMVRTSLAPHLSDPATRAIEVVVSDPSTENINAFAAKMAEGEIGQQRALVAFVQTLLEKDYLDKDDPLYKTLVQVSSMGLEGLYVNQPSALGRGASAAELKAGPTSQSGEDAPADAEVDGDEGDS